MQLKKWASTIALYTHPDVEPPTLPMHSFIILADNEAHLAWHRYAGHRLPDPHRRNDTRE